MKKLSRLLAAALLGLTTQVTSAADLLNLDAYKGKVVYVDFWASWCGPCRESFPWMKKMQQQHGKEGLAIIAINVDQDKKLADAFLTEFKPEFNVLFDQQGQLAEDFKVSSMPSSFILDRAGKPRFKHKGFHADKQAQYESELQTLLNEK